VNDTARLPSERTAPVIVFMERLFENSRTGAAKVRPPSSERAANTASRRLPLAGSVDA
jgi:hypothetical protein